MKKITFFFIAFLPLLLNAQPFRVPTDDDILRETLNSASEYYYPLLMARYMKGDRELTMEDYHYLYYGYAFQESYKPLEPMPEADNILMIIEKTSEPNLEQCLQIIKNAKMVMEKDPFSPTNLNMMAYAYSVLGDTISARTNVLRVAGILGTIKNSGNGLSERSPWVILSFSHAEDVMRSMDILPHSRRVVSRTVEYIDTGKRGSNVVKGYYFDYSRVYRNKPENIPAPDKRSWEINGIKLNKK